jgi:transposase InsO family protein
MMKGFSVSMYSYSDILVVPLDKVIIYRQTSDAIGEPDPGVIHHSDQGVQYALGDYVAELKSYGFEISMVRASSPFENAMMGSFFKHRSIRRCIYVSIRHLRIGEPGFPISLRRSIIRRDFIRRLITFHRMTLKN